MRPPLFDASFGSDCSGVGDEQMWAASSWSATTPGALKRRWRPAGRVITTDTRPIDGDFVDADWVPLLDLFDEHDRRPESPLLVRFDEGHVQPGDLGALTFYDNTASRLPIGRDPRGISVFNSPASQVLSLGVEATSLWRALQIADFMFQAWIREQGAGFRFTGGVTAAIYQWHRPDWWGPKLYSVERRIRPGLAAYEDTIDEVGGSLIW